MKHNYFKKALSLFLVVLMLMSSWVFVPFEAEAATAGSYYIEIKWSISGHNNLEGKYGGFNTEVQDSGGISIGYKPQNGVGDIEYKDFDIGNNSDGSAGGKANADGTYYLKTTVPGFPSLVYMYLNDNWFASDLKGTISEIKIGASKDSELIPVWTGTLRVATSTNPYAASVAIDGTKDDYFYKHDATYVNTTDNYWEYPYASTFTWSNTPEAMTAPATNDAAAATQKVKVSAKDQYGVQMFDPTWSITADERTDGITVATGQAEESTISVNYAANIPGTTNSQTATVTAKWDGAGDTKTDSKTFTITDAQYTATFTNRKDESGNAIADVVKYVYYGDKVSSADVPAQSDYDPNTDEHKYVFTGWNPSSFNAMTANVTHTAQYREEVVLADDAAAKAALNRAITYENLNDFDVRFNDEAKVRFSRAKAALSTAVVNGTYNRLEQAELDALTAELVAAMDHLDTDPALEEYDVIFMDGDRLIDIVQVLYGKPVTTDKIPSQEGFTKEPDSENHYTVSGWDTDLTSITENVLVYATYAGTPHTMVENGSVSATCSHGAGTEYICSEESCGYKSYESTGDINPDIHENVAQNTVTEPTCTTTGVAHEVCLDCGVTINDNIVIPATGHSYKSTPDHSVAATCQSTGLDTFTCIVCSHEEEVLTPKIQHNFTAGTGTNDTAEATCTEGAYTIYYCDCGVEGCACTMSYKKYTSQKLDHNFGGWTYADNANGTAVIATGTCQHSGCNQTITVEVANRNVASIAIVTQPTCTTAGSATVTYTTGNTTTVSVAANPNAHNYTTTHTPAVCGTAGSIIVKCTNTGCNHELYNETLPALAHNYSDWTVTREATCETDGSKYRTCAYCNAVDTVTIPRAAHTYFNVTGDCTSNTYDQCAVCGNREQISSATGHSFIGEETVIVSATCTTDGYKTVQCANEGCEVVTVVTIAKPTEPTHIYTEIYNKAPDCHGAGYKVEICSICGTITQGEYGTKVEHSYTVDVPDMSFPASCLGNGVTMKQCEHCGQYKQTIIAPLGHNHVITETVAPTCTSDGYTVKTCQCGDTIITDKTDATGHTTGNWVTKKEATCTSDGYAEEICTADGCGAIISTKTLPAPGHNYPATWTTVIPATCTTNGSEKRTCQNTGCGAEETRVIPMTGHNMQETATTESTCSSSAYTTWTCGNSCGHSYNVYAGGELKDHNYTWTYVRTGNNIAITGICDECNDKISFTIVEAQREVLTVELIQAATCQQEGTVKVTLSDNTERTYNIPKNENAHRLITSTQEANCEETGLLTTTCENSGCTYNDEVVLTALGHDFTGTAAVTDATCKTEGSAVFTCQRTGCDETITATIPKNEIHAWGEWSVTTSATETENGEMQRECADCDEIEKATIPAGGHKFNMNTPSSSVSSSCTVKGSETYACTVHTGENACGVVLTVELPLASHTVALNEATAPTCTTGGSIEAYCSVCDVSLGASKTVAPLGHNFEKSGEPQPANCTNDGSQLWKCSRCQASYTELIPKTGHNMVAGTPVAATCTTSGYTPYECANNCGNSYNVYDSEKPAKGHTWGTWTTVTPATATTEGTQKRSCTVTGCGAEETAPLPKLGHTMTEGAYLAPDCTNTGSQVYVCTTHTGDAACGYTYTVTIPATGHSLTTTVSRATCTDNGSVVTECSECSYTETSITLEATKHSYVGVVAPEPTCTTVGTKTYTCSKCNHSYTEEVEKLPHTYVKIDSETVGASCTTSGYEVYRCSCGESYHKVIEAPKAHNYVRLDAECDAATCTATGKEVYKCSACDAGYEYVTAKLPHTYTGSVSQQQSCTDEEITTFTCSCDDSYTQITKVPLGHNWDSWVVVRAATDTVDGEMTRTCKTNGTHTETIVIPATGGHTWNKGDRTTEPDCTNAGVMTFTCIDPDCQVCTAEDKIATKTQPIPALGHTESLVVENASCDQEGTAKVVCTECNNILKTEEIPAKGHNYVSAVITQAANCRNTGTITLACASCDNIITQTIPVDADAHVYETTASPATCDTPAFTAYTCKYCGDSYVKKTGPALGHTYVTNYDAPTCESAGSVVTYCITCLVEVTRQDLVPLGHNYIEGEGIDATCTSSGYVVYSCNRGNCNAAYSQIDATKPALGHSYTREVENSRNNATCTDDGNVTFMCSRCEATEVKTLSKLGHNMVAGEPVAATCTTSGYIPYECANNCGNSYNVYDSTKPAKGHTWGTWTTVTPATATTEGTQKRSCTVTGCGAEETAPLPKLGHTMTEGAYLAPDCTNTGSQVYVCTTHTGDAACGYTYTVTIPATGHVNLTTDKKAPTCEEDGYVKTTCSCGETVVNTVLPAFGHQTYVLPAVAPTCTQTGLTAGEKCAVCGEETVEQTEVDVLGHTEEIIPAIESTCASTGLTAGKKCSVCGEILTAQTVTQKKNHTEEIIPSVNPGCTTTGLTEGKKCSVCGEILLAQTSVAATDHRFGDAVVTQATCNVKGTAVFVCSNNCGKTLTAEIPVNDNHEWSEWEETTNGVLTRECSVCPATETITLPSGGHQFDLDNPTSSTPSTCYEAGEKVYKCTAHDDCNAEIRVTLPTTAHSVAMEVIRDATCSEKGLVRAYCDDADCGADLGTLETDTVDHNYAVKKSETPASCSAEGEIIWKCATCEATRTEKLPKKAHSYTEKEYEATCLTGAYKVYTCSCGDSYEVYGAAEAKDHTWGAWTTDTPATATAEGTQKRICTVPGCGAEETSPIPKLGHTMIASTAQGDYKAPTCTEEGYQVYVCQTHTGNASCAYTYTVTLSKINHDLETIKVDPTCDTDGSVTTKCKDCDYKIVTVLNKRGHKSAQIIPAVAATCEADGLTAGAKCSACGEILIPQETVLATGHTYVDEVIAPTCDADGYTKHSCIKCDREYNTDTVPASGHNYGRIIFIWNSEGTSAEAERRCLNDANHVDELTVTMSIASDAANCLFKGTTTYTATVTIGSEVFTDTNVIVGEIGEHSLTHFDAQEESCTEDGNIEYWYCSVCRSYYTDAAAENEVESVVIKSGHKKQTTPAVEPTCTETGLTEGEKCSVCGEILTEQEIVDALGHTEEYVDFKAPTCIADGNTAGYRCSVCGESISGYEVIPALGHTEVSTQGKAPTCTEPGYTEAISCSVCFDVIVPSTEIPATGHNMGEWIITTSPTCTNKGEEKQSCTACDYYVTRELNPVSTAHIWGEWEHTADYEHMRVCQENRAHVQTGTCSDAMPTQMSATCMEHSYMLYVCDYCSHEWRVYDETSEFVDHSYTKFFYNNDATCETDGTKFAYCDYGCGTKSENITAEGSAKNHSWTQWKTVKESSCSSYRVEERKCSLCGKIETKENTAAGYGSHYLIIKPGKEATCTYAGYEDYLYCVDCSYTQQATPIPMLEHKDDDGDGNCDLCEGPYFTDDDGNSTYCDCMCHKSGISGFIYKIIRFFWQIFSINEVCECGENHY